MAKKVQYTDIADKNLFGPGIKSAKEFAVVLDDLEKQFKDILKVTSDIAKKETLTNLGSIKKFEKAVNDSKKAVEGLDEVEKRRQKLQKQLAALEDDRAQGLADLSEQLRVQRKELRDQAKAAQESGNAYKVLTRETNKAQAEFKRLAAEFGVNSKEAKEAREEFERLEEKLREVDKAAKDGRRQVGRYEIAVESLRKTFPKLSGAIDDANDKLDSLNKAAKATGAIAVLTKLFEGFQNVLGNNSEAAAGFEKALGRVTIVFTALLSRLTTGLPVFIDFIKSGFGQVETFFDRITLKIQIAVLEATNAFGANDDKIKELSKNLEELSKAASTNQTAFSDVVDVFSGVTSEIDTLISKNDQLIDRTLTYRKEIIGLQNKINDLLGTQAELQNAADDENNSLLDRIKNQKELIKTTTDINKLELQQATKREELALRNAEIFDKSIDAQEEAANATSERIALQIQQQEERLAQTTELATLEADVLEQNLDFLIDNFDNIKTQNERRLANEQLTFEERKKLLEENQRLEEESFEAQLQLFNDRLDKQGKAQLDFEKLVTESDSRKVAQEALNAGLSERLTTRLLEVIRERRTITQDTIETERDLIAAQKESIELEAETALNLEAVNKLKEQGVGVEKVLSDLEDKRLELTISNLRTQINLLKDGSEERIKLENELSQALLEQGEKRREKQLTAEKTFFEKLAETAQTGLDALSDILDKSLQKRLEAIDRAIEASKKREEELRELAKLGSQEATDNLAFEQRRQAELLQQRERAEQRAARLQLAVSAVQTYSGKVQANDPNALTSTITDISLLQAFIESLPTFWEGAEHVGDALGTPDIAGKDGHIVRVDGGERVVPTALNAMIPKGMSNEQLASIAANVSVNTNDGYLGAKIDNLTNVIEKKPSYMGRDFDATAKAVVETVVMRGRIERNHKKIGGIWG